MASHRRDGLAGGGKRKGESMSRIVESRREDGKGKDEVHDGNKAVRFRTESWTLRRHQSARDCESCPERPTHESCSQPKRFSVSGIFGSEARVRRTGPSGEGRPRSVLRLRYLRAVFALGAGFLLRCCAALFFFCAFSFSALATAVRNAFVSTL